MDIDYAYSKIFLRGLGISRYLYCGAIFFKSNTILSCCDKIGI